MKGCGNLESFCTHFHLAHPRGRRRTCRGRRVHRLHQLVDRADRHDLHQPHQDDDRARRLLVADRRRHEPRRHEDARAHQRQDRRHLPLYDGGRHRHRLRRRGRHSSGRRASDERHGARGEGSAVHHAGLRQHDPDESRRVDGEGRHPARHHLRALHRRLHHAGWRRTPAPRSATRRSA